MTRKPLSTIAPDTPQNDSAATPAQVLAFTQEAAVAAFRTSTACWHTASLSMVAGATVVLFCGQANGTSAGETLEVLTTAVKERGVAKAQAFRYLGLARALFQELAKLHPGDKTGAQVLSATSAEAAAEVVLAWCQRKKISSLDRLGLSLGVYARTPKRASASTAQANAAESGTSRAESTAEVEPAPRAVAPVLRRLSAPEIVEAIRLSETDPVEVVEAIAAAAAPAAVREMISVLQQQLDRSERSERAPAAARWRSLEDGTQTHQ